MNNRFESEMNKVMGMERGSFGAKVLREAENFWKDEEGMGTIEVVLILVVLIGLVITFKTSIATVLKNIMESITSKSEEITGKK